jgi:hypothetical protein
MARLRTRRLGWIVVGCVLVSSCYVATHYSGWQYRGGRLINNGIVTRPRFQTRFAEIPLNVPGAYTYTFSRFPATDAVVMLATPSEPPEDPIRNLATQVRLRLVYQDGRLLCDGTGSPRGTGRNQLVVTSSAGVIGLWHTSCALLQLHACNPCQLHVSVGPVDPATPSMLLVPTLEGGGFELP